jgi:hypothetical protein
MTLKEIALELLGKYRDSEESLIWEYSGDIQKSMENLDNICNTYRNMIIEAADVQPVKHGKEKADV